MDFYPVDDLKSLSGHGAGINDGTAVKNQYRTADNLNTRISIHSKYSTNKQGFGNWITSHYRIREGASVLEKTLSTLIQTNETYESTQTGEFHKTVLARNSEKASACRIGQY